ncbi:hypothetical protein DXG01_001450 [Tephrocybe rancida]|nr:hypothetical protein DXG01_001450 [Tephrocybe rancida]
MLTSSRYASLPATVNDDRNAIVDFIQEMHDVNPPRPKRQRVIPPRFLNHDFELNDPDLVDFLPAPLTSLPGSDVPQDNVPIIPEPSQVRVVDTAPNTFDVFRRFTRFPAGLSGNSYAEQHDPETQSDMTSMSGTPPQPDRANVYAPFPNRNSFLLSNWFWNNGLQKSKENFQQLLQIIGSPDFSPEDISGTNWDQLDKQLGINDWDREEWQEEDAGWQESSVTISVPFHRNTDHPGPKDYVVPGFYHRSLMGIISEKLTVKKEDAAHFHLEPYELLWHPSHLDDPIPLYGEMYSSSAFLRAHQELQQSPAEPGCVLPRVVVALMFWSDATHLTQFGSAKVTPLYLYFGNESKYRRCMPSKKLAEHAAFFQQLPDVFKDFAKTHTGGKKINAELMAHCNRELVHEQWKILLDAEFLHAYEHGIVLKWVGDGEKRRFYPRIMTYSADYPEKVVMSTIRQMGGCPCPRCRIPKADIHLLGSPVDRAARITLERTDNNIYRKKIEKARGMIYGKKNMAIDSAAVERELKPESLVPTVNAFSDRLQKFGLHWPAIFAVDLLHEIELGVWKNLLIHLLRILESVDDNMLHELDRRFRLVPTFGRDTIRRFSRNASELKKMAARDYEDLLQCIIPVFDGLLPDENLNTSVINLLFQMAHWHGLAKLRLHSSFTMDLLDLKTTVLGDALRNFKQEVCPKFATRELRREAAARERREASKAAKAPSNPKPKKKAVEGPQAITDTQADTTGGQVGSQIIGQAGVGASVETGPAMPVVATPRVARKAKTFSLSTYKMHAIGDYFSTIQTFGTTDSYSTETGELEHRVPKANYKRTSKKAFLPQLARIDRRQARLYRIDQATTDVAPIEVQTSETSMDLSIHYHIGISQHLKQDIRVFLQENTGDPAIEYFSVDLQSHLLARLKALLGIEPGIPASVDLQSPQAERVYYKGDALYRHNILRINYTSYDIRRLQDVLNPRTDHRDVMLLRRYRVSTKHQYRYARVLGIYHVNAIYNGPTRRDVNVNRLDFVWVRWFELIDGHDVPAEQTWSNHLACLSQLQFLPISDRHAFGFLDPKEILRACHIVPRFRSGPRHTDEVGLSGLARDGKDSNIYCVNRFVDRDLLMRFHWGLGIGHTSSRTTLNKLDHAQAYGFQPTETRPIHEPLPAVDEELPNPDSRVEGDSYSGEEDAGGDSGKDDGGGSGEEDDSLASDSESATMEDSSEEGDGHEPGLGSRWWSKDEDFEDMYRDDDSEDILDID